MALSKVVDNSIESVDAAKLTGTIADARFPATLPAISGANLTNIDALPAVGSSGNVLTSDGTNWASTAAAGGGKVLQVVSTEKSDKFSTASTSYVDVTGFTVTITPSAVSSKVLILANYSLGNTSASHSTHLTLLRGSTLISIGDDDTGRERASGTTLGMVTTEIGNGVIHILDSPSTTSSTVYKVQMRVSSGTGTFNSTGHDAHSQNGLYPRTSVSFTAIEIGA